MFYMKGAIVIMKGCLLVRQRRSKKGQESRIFDFKIIPDKKSKNNNKSEEEEEVRKLIKVKMDKGLESESVGEEQLNKVTKPKKGKGSKAEKPYPTFELPSALAYHAIDHFHPGSIELRLEKGSIKATRQKLHDMLAIALVISDTTESDFMFRMNFITLFGSTMGTLDNGGKVSMKLLKRITEDVDISDIDRCDYILDCLNTSKKNWKDVKTRKNFYYGPLTFLCFDPEEEQDGMNVYKGLDVYVPPINDKEPETNE
ncbi:hypothetical protein Tco_1022367, partial [Tanacetum coccineum]